MKSETWKSVFGYEGFYEVSNYGNVRSLDRKLLYPDGIYRTRKGRIMSMTLNERGYFSVGLNKGNRQKTYMVHNLVAASFIENLFNKPIVNHKDLNKLNNHVENLEWVTLSENVQHAILSGALKFKTGKENHMTGRFDELNHYSKPVFQFSTNPLVLIAEFPSARAAARLLCLNFKLISECANGFRNTHGGFAWSFQSDKLSERKPHRSSTNSHCRDAAALVIGI